MIPTPRTAVGQGRDVAQRLDLLEARIGQLPERLSTQGARIDDWDEAVSTGFYWSPDGYTGVVMFSDEPTVGVLIQERRKRGVPGIQRRSFDGLVWSPWMRQSVTLAGTAEQRATMTPGYWDFWQDTNGTERLYVGSKAGTWRQFEGSAVAPSAAWSTTQGTPPAAIVVGRTATITIDTVLEVNENLLITATSVGSGFGIVSQNGLVKNPTNTAVTVRLMQLGATTEQQYAFAWQIVQYT